MLSEITAVKQDPEWAVKQWFKDEVMDLFVWRGPGRRIEKFQLSCRTGDGEYAVTWSTGAGFLRHRVDDGEQRPARYKATPILVPARSFPLDRVTDEFKGRAGRLDPEIRELVAARLVELPAA